MEVTTCENVHGTRLNLNELDKGCHKRLTLVPVPAECQRRRHLPSSRARAQNFAFALLSVSSPFWIVSSTPLLIQASARFITRSDSVNFVPPSTPFLFVVKVPVCHVCIVL